MTHEADVIGDRAHFAQLDNALVYQSHSALGTTSLTAAVSAAHKQAPLWCGCIPTSTGLR